MKRVINVSFYYLNSEPVKVSKAYMNNKPLTRVYNGSNLVWEFEKVDYTIIDDFFAPKSANSFYFVCVKGRGILPGENNNRADIKGLPAYAPVYNIVGDNSVCVISYAEKFKFGGNCEAMFADWSGGGLGSSDLTINLDSLPYAYFVKDTDNKYTPVISNYNLKQSSEAFEYIVDMSSMFDRGRNTVYGSPKCGRYTVDMAFAYEGLSQITGSPNVGKNVINMCGAYKYCSNLTGSPVAGDYTEDMHDAYSGCVNLTGSPVCPDSVVYFNNAYYNCFNITGDAVCGNNVDGLVGTYRRCYRLNGKPACGVNVTNMLDAYEYCNSLSSGAVSGDLVTNMRGCYNGCTNLKGDAACGANVTDMTSAYRNCYSLDGSPACGYNVVDFTHTYYNCQSLTGAPVCGDLVTSLVNTYYNCKSMRGAPVCGLNVTNMENAYRNCYNITGTAACGSLVKSMSRAYENCYNLKTAYVGSNVVYMSNAFANCKSLSGAPVFPKNINSYGSISYAYSDCISLTGPVSIPDYDIEFSLYDTFRNCVSLRGSVHIPYNATSIGSCFVNTGISDIYFKNRTDDDNLSISRMSSKTLHASGGWYNVLFNQYSWEKDDNDEYIYPLYNNSYSVTLLNG